MEYHIANNFENQIEKTLENIIEIRTSNELSLTPTDVLNLPTIQNIRDETIRKRHTDAKKRILIFLQIRQYTITGQFQITFRESKQVRIRKQHTSPEKKTRNDSTNNKLLKIINFENNYRTIQHLITFLLA